jgi:transposase InsO family protein/transposase-like protein
MYSQEERTKAIELYIKYDHSAAAVIHELGYPTHPSLLAWYREYLAEAETGVPRSSNGRQSKYPSGQKQVAVDHYLQHGHCLSRTVRALGYPTKQGLRAWVDELAPGKRKALTCMTKDGRANTPFEQKKAAVVDLCSRKGAAKEIAEKHGTDRDTLYRWKYELLGKEATPVRPDEDRTLPDDPETLKGQISDLQGEIRGLEYETYRLRMEKDILEATVEMVKKDPGADPASLTNREKAILIGALRTVYPLTDLLACLDMAKSSYFYQVNAMAAPDKYATARVRIKGIFEESGGAYGYRRVWGDLGNGGTTLSEKVVRRIMAEDGLVVSVKRRRKYSSYKGDISPEVEDLVKRDFHAESPNELWLTDITEFHIPAGKVYLSPVLDCFDGMLVSWTIGTSPNAELANTMLDAAIDTLDEGEHPVVHNDRGCHYRWPGWIARMEEAGLARSMSKKGCSPDNAACEGLFGRVKNEMFYYRSWKEVSVDGFIATLDNYLHWYNEQRIKQSLGWMSPVQYRESLGLAA